MNNEQHPITDAVRIMILDKDDTVRTHARELLSREPAVAVVGEATNIVEAMAKINSLHPDVLLINLSIGGEGRIDLLKEIKVHHPNIRLLAATINDDCQYILEFSETSVPDYLVKIGSTDSFLSTLRNRGIGTKPVSAGPDNLMIRNWATKARDRWNGSSGFHLTPREEQMLKLLAQGKSNQEIAGILSIKASTVRTHRAALMGKLGVPTRADFVRFTVAQGYITPS